MRGNVTHNCVIAQFGLGSWRAGRHHGSFPRVRWTSLSAAKRRSDEVSGAASPCTVMSPARHGRRSQRQCACCAVVVFARAAAVRVCGMHDAVMRLSQRKVGRERGAVSWGAGESTARDNEWSQRVG